MADNLTISDKKPSLPVLDYQFLREEGLKYIEKLSSKIWTDYNIHDPGLTILELLCYAITDLGYRSTYPIEDILAAREDNAENMNAQFMTAARILSTRPVSESDYRKLLIDIQGIKNAWLMPAKVSCFVDCPKSQLEAAMPAGPAASRKVDLNGLYSVLLELEPSVSQGDNAEIETVVQAAMSRLQENRNLCEDFLEIKTIDQKEFILCAEIDLAPEADVALTEARIFDAIHNYLNPPVNFYSLQEMFDRNNTAEEIFNGPALEHGFIDTRELEKTRIKSEIRLSDVIRKIMDIEGVLAVKDIIMAPADAPAGISDDNKWVIPVWQPPGPMLQPVVDRSGSRLVYYKDLIPFRADPATVDQHIQDLQQVDNSGSGYPGSEDIPVPVGQFRDIESYSSFQNDFPKVYGIGRYGLPESATVQRKAQARQLKAYLLFFDQVLANYFAQLANVKALFSIDEEISQSYFTQVVSGVAEADGLYVDHATLAQTIQALTEDNALFLKRRNRFLNHLLARFAENFNDYVWTMYARDTRNADAEAVRAKLMFLKEFDVVSSHRAGAFNYQRADALWDTDNVSGLAHRAARLLGIRNFQRRNLSEIVLDIYEERDKDELKEFRFRIIDETESEDGKILLSSSWKFLDPSDAMAEMRKALSYCLDRKNYDLKTARDGRFYFNVIDESGDVIARRIEYFKTEALRDDAIQYLIDLLQEKYSDEGFFVVEHILLRPIVEGQTLTDEPSDSVMPAKVSKFLPICVQPDCSDAAYIDPYSFRISVILPAWTKRFESIESRRFVEKTLRLETPAHILPKICWLDQEQMQVFEKTFRRWLDVTYGKLKASKMKALNDLIDVLSNLRSVYDEATLAPCDERPDDQPPFILDKTILGTED